MNMRKFAGAALAMILVGAAFAPSAEAQNNDVVSEGQNPADFLYWEDGFLVITEGTTADVCAGDPPPTLPGQRVAARNGSNIWFTRATVSVSVYEIPDFGQERIDLVFGWILDNCETEAYALGSARLNARFRFDTKGVLHIRNGVNGTALTPDGNGVRVHTFARLDVEAATGALIKLDQLRVDVR